MDKGFVGYLHPATTLGEKTPNYMVKGDHRTPLANRQNQHTPFHFKEPLPRVCAEKRTKHYINTLQARNRGNRRSETKKEGDSWARSYDHETSAHQNWDSKRKGGGGVKLGVTKNFPTGGSLYKTKLGKRNHGQCRGKKPQCGPKI